MNIVLDTKVLVAGLLSPFGTCGKIVRMASSGKLTIAFDARIYTEYQEVLARPKFRFDQEKVAAILEFFKHHGAIVAASPLKHPLPDPDDEPFLEVAVSVQATCIVTGNVAHFPAELCRETHILSPTEFLALYRRQMPDQQVE